MATKLDNYINRAIPDSIREDNPQFVLFMEKYFEYISRDLGEFDISSGLLDYLDIDNTIPEFYEDFKKTYAPLLPEKYKATLSTIVKNSVKFYQSKGTEESFKTFFRMIFDTTVDLYYPKDDMLRVSDGKWTEPYYLAADATLTYDDLTYYYDKRITGSDSNAFAYVEDILTITDPDDASLKILVLSLVDRTGIFVNTDTITVEGETTPSFILNTAGSKGVITGQGYWKGTDGFLSWNKYIQDSDYYQDYSYVIKSPIAVELYEKSVKENLHPAGLKLFGLVSEGISFLDLGVALTDYIFDIIVWTNLEDTAQSINSIKQTMLSNYQAPLSVDGNNYDWKYFELNKDITPFIQLYTLDAIGSLSIDYVSSQYPENFLTVTIDDIDTTLYTMSNETLTLDNALVNDALIKVVTTDPYIPVNSRIYDFTGKIGDTVFTLPTIISRMWVNGKIEGSII